MSAGIARMKSQITFPAGGATDLSPGVDRKDTAMATTRFDQLTTDVARSHTRRSALRLLGLALLGGASLGLAVDPTSAKNRGNTRGHREDRLKPGGRKTDGTPEPGRRKRPSGEDSGRTPRVSGGATVHKGKYPFATSVTLNVAAEDSVKPGDGYTYSCSGSLIDPTHVLTAAHCTINKKARPLNGGLPFELDAYTVLVGQVDRSPLTCAKCRKGVTKVVADEAYDIAILTLDSPVEPSVARPIPLIFTGQHNLDASGQVATVAGWGRTTTDEPADGLLREAPLTVRSGELCASDIGILPEYVLCTAVEGGRDACAGDSGGPLFVKHDAFAGGYVQIGVVTWGPKGCPSASSTYGQMYTRLSNRFINALIRGVAPEAGGSTACTSCQVGDTCCPPSPEFPRGFCALRGVACPPVGASPEPPPPACATCKPGQRCCPRSPQFPDGFCASAAVACPPAGAVRAKEHDRPEQAADASPRKRGKGHDKRSKHASGRHRD